MSKLKQTHLFKNGAVSLAIIAIVDSKTGTFLRLEQRAQRLMRSNQVPANEHHITLYTMVFNFNHPDTAKILNDPAFWRVIKKAFQKHFLEGNCRFQSPYGQYGIFGQYFVRKYDIIDLKTKKIVSDQVIAGFRAEIRNFIIQNYGKLSPAGTKNNITGVKHHLYSLGGKVLYGIPEWDHGNSYSPHVSLVNVKNLSNSNDNSVNGIANHPDPATPLDVNNPPNNKLKLLVDTIHTKSQSFPLDPVSYIWMSDFSQLNCSIRVFGPKNHNFKSVTLDLKKNSNNNNNNH